MQSDRDTSAGTPAKKRSSDIDFGEGEPYIESDEDVAYIKRFQQINTSGTGVKKKVSKMEEVNESTYGTNSQNSPIYGNRKDKRSYVSKTKSNFEQDNKDYDSVKKSASVSKKVVPKKEENDNLVADKDSLEEEEIINKDDEDSVNLEEQYDRANPPTTVDDKPTTSKPHTLETQKEEKEAEENVQYDEPKHHKKQQREPQSPPKKSRPKIKPDSVVERLSRDAMSLKRHQIRASTDPDPSEERRGGREKSREDKSARKSRRSKSRKREEDHDDHEEESRKKVTSAPSDGKNQKKPYASASHEIYGEEYSNKYHLPPRSPTFSFRSTIDLLPSSHRRQGLRQQIIVTLSCCLGPFACGFALGYIFAVSPDDIIGIDAGVWRTYAYFIGCIGGGFFSGLLVNMGRKRTLLVMMTPFALSWLAVVFATELWMLLLFQASAGFCTAIVMVLSQVYVSEVATPGIRGAISCAPILALQSGALFCYGLINVLMWRQLAAMGMGITLPFFITVVLCMPESPRFLVHVRPNDALATLQWLRGIEGDVMEEYRDIADNSDTDRWSIDMDDLSRPTFWRPLAISCGLMFLYNMTGLASFGLYGMELFSEVSKQSVNVAYYINTTIVIIGIVIASILVDQIGRKLLLLLSITIMAASAFTIGLFMFLKDYNKVESYFEYQWAAEVFCVVLFTFAHGTGMSPIAWITMGEVFGPRHKWIGVTFSSIVFWSSAIAVDVIFHNLRYAVLTGGIFWFHCVMCVGGYIFVLLCFRELKEQRIDDITKSFTKKHDSLIDTFITRI